MTDEILPTYLADCVKARVLGEDGVYTRTKCETGKNSQAQLTFRNLARKAASHRVDKNKATFDLTGPLPAVRGAQKAEKKKASGG